MVDKGDRGLIGEPAEKRRADAGDTEGKAEEQPGHHADPSGN